jgi:HPt (histidine-containing phosphotransfer) domain-containing protein
MGTLEDKIAELNKKYAVALGGRIEELYGYLAAYEKKGSARDLEKFYKSVHAVAGSARTFGLPEVSVKAKDLELAARDGEDIKILHEKLYLLKKCVSS